MSVWPPLRSGSRLGLLGNEELGVYMTEERIITVWHCRVIVDGICHCSSV